MKLRITFKDPDGVHECVRETSRVLGDLHAARGLLTVLHAQAERSPIRTKAVRLPAIRAAMAAVEAAIDSASVPLDMPETRLMDCAPTAYGPPSHSHRTEQMTLVEARL